MPGYESKEWIEQELGDHPTCILIDATSGEFVGLAYTRHIALAKELIGKGLQFPDNSSSTTP